MNIVIVDDEPKIRNGLLKLLSSHKGWKVIGVFEDARSALEFLDKDHADVIITDIKMPEISGLELIHAIKEKKRKIHIIILSGYSNFSYAQKAIELGVMRYLTKPTNPKELIEVLQTVEDKINVEAKVDMNVDKTEVNNQVVLEAIKYIESNYNTKISLKMMAEELYISPNYLCELFKKHTGKNLGDYILEYRLKKSKLYLNQIEYKISDIAEMVGFANQKYFSSTFKKYFGLSPLEYRNKNTNS